MERENAKREILDIILRRDQERPLETWRSDISRMTDMLCNLWSESRIEFGGYYHARVPHSEEISEIEKTEDGYVVTVGGEKINLNAIDDEYTLAPLLHMLLWKEWVDWDYNCDEAGSKPYDRQFCEEAGVKSLAPVYQIMLVKGIIGLHTADDVPKMSQIPDNLTIRLTRRFGPIVRQHFVSEFGYRIDRIPEFLVEPVCVVDPFNNELVRLYITFSSLSHYAGGESGKMAQAAEEVVKKELGVDSLDAKTPDEIRTLLDALQKYMYGMADFFIY